MNYAPWNWALSWILSKSSKNHKPKIHFINIKEPTEIDNLGDLDIDENIILSWSLKEQDERA